MYKSGIILAIISLLLATGFTLLSPMCVPAVALMLGLIAGLLAGVFDKPSETGKSAKSGAVAGAIGGVGAILGQILGAILNSIIMGSEGAARFVEQLGGNTQTGFATGYWAGVVGSALCFSLLDILFMAGCGALGCLAWKWLFGKKHGSSLANS